MQRGLWWTTQKIDGHSWYRRHPEDKNWKFSRSWSIREFPNKSGWIVTFTVYASTIEELAAFRLHTLGNHHIGASKAEVSSGKSVLMFNRLDPGMGIGCIFDGDPSDVW
ncbi:hypothetical protein B0T26DRAFT_682684 [Lasiosphaeria miniovina]|uniref:Uncharacterized protein n=1 Tax=Lasiosphaeria miniovina TaxID=1954250 RepID=A0AA40BF45_9PEZI|nr:uncharacterized protein B0T26DRAFT_682684 [Lasiosphaeria miniovina]KAK0733046.1 hypothetical protein B0T26DRAFT_682684 [Lasiosphaeria miniovina]